MSLQFLINFIIGGLIVTGTTHVVETFGTKPAAILWSIPYTLFPVMFTLWYNKKSNEKIAKLGLHSSYSLIILFIFLMTFYLALTYYIENKYGLFYALGIAFVIWSIFAYIFYCCL